MNAKCEDCKQSLCILFDGNDAMEDFFMKYMLEKLRWQARLDRHVVEDIIYSLLKSFCDVIKECPINATGELAEAHENGGYAYAVASLMTKLGSEAQGVTADVVEQLKRSLSLDD